MIIKFSQKRLITLLFCFAIFQVTGKTKEKRSENVRTSALVLSLCPSVISVMAYFSWLSGFRYEFVFNSTP